MFFILLILGFLLGFKFFESLKLYKAAKQEKNVTRYEVITLWGYGLGFVAVIMMIIPIALVMDWLPDMGFLTELLFDLLIVFINLGYIILPVVECVFMGIVHFATIRPYRQKKLNHLEDKMHITSGIVFYTLIVLFLLFMWFLHSLSGQLSHM
ncbi:MAG: hypothetical protein E7263_07580 [Lachnospiraceae bacterium]|nr:hypothetical protein [Lachnospiraceae bacterium]